MPLNNPDDYEETFKEFLDDLENYANDEHPEDISEIIRTQNELLELLYDAVVYAHQSDYPSHFSSEIKKANQIIQEFRNEDE